MLPTPATRTRLLIGNLEVQRLDLLEREKESVPEKAALSQVAARIVLQGHRDMDPVLVVLLYALDERDLPLEGEVHDVSPSTGPEQDPASLRELDATHDHALERRHLLFLLVREVEYVQDEHLIDLGPIEQVTGALGRDLRVVGEDDRGGEQHIPLPFLSDEHGPRLQILTPFRGLP